MSTKKLNKRGHLNCGKTQIYLPKNDTTTARISLGLLNDSDRWCTIKILLLRPYFKRSKSLLRKPATISVLYDFVLYSGHAFQVPEIITQPNQALTVICRSKKDIIYRVTGVEHV